MNVEMRNVFTGLTYILVCFPIADRYYIDTPELEKGCNFHGITFDDIEKQIDFVWKSPFGPVWCYHLELHYTATYDYYTFRIRD